MALGGLSLASIVLLPILPLNNDDEKIIFLSSYSSLASAFSKIFSITSTLALLHCLQTLYRPSTASYRENQKSQMLLLTLGNGNSNNNSNNRKEKYRGIITLALIGISSVYLNSFRFARKLCEYV